MPADVWGVRDGSEARHEMWVRDKVPYIIPPITEKASVFRHEALRAIWRRAANGINSAEDIYLIGYSLPPTDLGMLLFFKQGYRMTPPKAKIHIVNPSVEVYDRVTDELGTVYDKGEYYSTINQFVEDVVTP